MADSKPNAVKPAPAPKPEAPKQPQKEESRHDKFRRLAIDRVQKAIARIGLVRNLGNRLNYDYTEQEAQRVIEALRDAVDDVASAFTSKSTQSHTFSF